MSQSSQQKQRVVVICPGRGTYNKDELGYFHRYHADKLSILDVIDEHRAARGQIPVATLDTMPAYNLKLHSAGENASALIYACSAGDFAAINRDKYDIVAVTGNSMGWYIALAVSQALNEKNGINVINTMGSMMEKGVIGGQLIYPIVNDKWQIQPDIDAKIEQCIHQVNKIEKAEVYRSIYLGGYAVLGGNKLGLSEISKLLPIIDDRYPMNLYNHAAFHTPLMDDTSVKAKNELSKQLFSAPNIPMIDGQGNIWQPYSTSGEKLYDYTLGDQVNTPYNYSKAIEVAVKEFAPDKLIILGPGATLGGATAQALIAHKWHEMVDKESFISKQKSDPFILAMGLAEQRKLVTE